MLSSFKKHRWARVRVREGGYPKILAEGGSIFSARGGELLKKEKNLRGGSKFWKNGLKRCFLKHFWATFWRRPFYEEFDSNKKHGRRQPAGKNLRLDSNFQKMVAKGVF